MSEERNTLTSREVAKLAGMELGAFYALRHNGRGPEDCGVAPGLGGPLMFLVSEAGQWMLRRKMAQRLDRTDWHQMSVEKLRKVIEAADLREVEE